MQPAPAIFAANVITDLVGEFLDVCSSFQMTHNVPDKLMVIVMREVIDELIGDTILNDITEGDRHADTNDDQMGGV